MWLQNVSHAESMNTQCCNSVRSYKIGRDGGMNVTNTVKGNPHGTVNVTKEKDFWHVLHGIRRLAQGWP